MRHLVVSALAILATTWLVPTTHADDDPKDIVKKAIEAHGGADNLKKFLGTRAESKGSISIMGMDFEFTTQSISQYPDKQKTIIQLDFMGNSLSIVQSINGDQVSLMVNNMSQEVPDEQKQELKRGIEMQKVMNLTPLLEEKDYELKVIPGVKVNDRDTVGISVTGRERPEIKVYFDKETYLLLKVERKALDPSMAGVEALQETILADYKEFNGVKKPMKTTIFLDGRKFMDAVNTKLEVVEKIDDKEFSD
ncbi:MAG: hypothetical protein N2039_13230 [Gemmataceae bacterium]|nr:hypothetical protein [Gemmataceae bacterium]